MLIKSILMLLTKPFFESLIAQNFCPFRISKFVNFYLSCCISEVTKGFGQPLILTPEAEMQMAVNAYKLAGACAACIIFCNILTN